MKDLNFLKSNNIFNEKLVFELGTDTYNELLETFLNEIMGKINNLQIALGNRDLLNYTTYVHDIKGESLYLGFNELANIALTHQQKGEAGDLDYIYGDFNNIINEICRVIKVIRIYLGRE